MALVSSLFETYSLDFSSSEYINYNNKTKFTLKNWSKFDKRGIKEKNLKEKLRFWATLLSYIQCLVLHLSLFAVFKICEIMEYLT